MPPTILDSHIHLWPSTATSSQDHAWMTPGLFLARRHGVHDYAAATAAAPVQPAGFVYVETDRYLPSASLSLDAGAGDEEVEEKLSAWARAPLEELAFLRRVVEGDVQEGDGASEGDGEQMKGLVIWAPFHVQERVFGTYLRVARERLGEKAWARVVGFRYLLQGRTADEVKSIIGNEWFVSNVKLACEKGERRLAFDVGVDAHRDGIEALEAVAALIEGVEEGVNFVLNHLCKPDLSTPTWPFFPRWQACIGRLSSHPNVYMKLSGALNEFAPSATPSSVETVLDTLRPYLDYVLQSFGAHRVLFGSDWPVKVCNVGGPKGEVGNWGFWVEVVERYWEEKELSEKDIEWVWAKSAAAAYGIKELR